MYAADATAKPNPDAALRAFPPRVMRPWSFILTAEERGLSDLQRHVRLLGVHIPTRAVAEGAAALDAAAVDGSPGRHEWHLGFSVEILADGAIWPLDTGFSRPLVPVYLVLRGLARLCDRSA